MWRTTFVPSGRLAATVAPPPPSMRIWLRIAAASSASIPANHALSGAITAAASAAETGAGAGAAAGAAAASSKGSISMRRLQWRLLGGATVGARRPAEIGGLPYAIFADEGEMIDAAMMHLAVDREGIGRPHHRDVAVDLDRRIGKAFLVLFRAGREMCDQVGRADMRHGACAVRLLGGDGLRSKMAQLLRPRLPIARGNGGKQAVDRYHRTCLLAARRGQGGTLHDRLDRRDLRCEEEKGEDHGVTSFRHCFPKRGAIRIGPRPSRQRPC